MSFCSESPPVAVSGGSVGVGDGEIILFGVRVKVDPLRKSVSMNNLSEYEPVSNINNNDLPKITLAADDGSAAGYASADEAVPQRTNGSRERKKGVSWTEDEHKLFLLGLQKVGKGDWRGISRNYVKTRTPTQVASHAQKYFQRRSNLNRRRRRTSLFDITTDSVTAMPIEKGSIQHQNPPQPLPPPVTPALPFPMTVPPVMFSIQDGNSMEILALGHNSQVTNSSAMVAHPIPIPSSSPMIDLNLNQQLSMDPSPISLNLSLSSEQDHQLTREGSSFPAITFLKAGDSLITVA